ncbi:uncharacterized protein LOC133778695 [Humulus lupulus]|uniref:uncharacterized protein LOC133778695 n=1 Tax=Humulus lupulus TaxID=3486 RepID=UPI002B40CFA2|nr:uncharacterized protein LOC133778695 [Humulus lupulus]
MRHAGSRRRRVSIQSFAVVCAMFGAMGLFMLNLRAVDPPTTHNFLVKLAETQDFPVHEIDGGVMNGTEETTKKGTRPCATVEEMGEDSRDGFWKNSLRVRRIIDQHFDFNGAQRVRILPPEQFCRRGFVLGKASEAGLGNEMYKILSAAALSIMLNRSLIIGQTREKFPFGDYILYSNVSFTLKEIKHLWRHNKCEKKYGRRLAIRTDNFEKPTQTNVLCSNWRAWKQPIIWFQGTTDAVAIQFFLKNVHPEMRSAATDLFGKSDVLQSRPNVFGELMRVLISPSKNIEEAVNWVLGGGADPDISLHMRMLMNKSVRAVQAALNCIKKTIHNLNTTSRPRVVVVSDTPSLVTSITPDIGKIAEVLHFNYEHFRGNVSMHVNRLQGPEFRVKDWGPAPRWVAFVDFFLASRAKHAVVSGAHRRVGTTYAQLIAALAAANNLGDNSTGSSFSFLSSFQRNLLREGLRFQIGWGHVWNRYAGILSCHHQPNQCARTPLLPPAWWDGIWQSPLPRDVHKLEDFGVQLSGFGTIDETHLQNFCNSRKSVVKTIPIPL